MATASAMNGLHGGVKFISISRYTASLRQHGIIEHDNHERLIGDAVPLAAETVSRCGLETKAWIVLRVSQHDDERTTGLTEVRKPVVNELRSYALALVGWRNRHWCQAHSCHGAAFNGYRSEQYVPDDGVILDGDESEILCARVAETIYDLGLRNAFKCSQVQTVDGISVRCLFPADFNHEFRVAPQLRATLLQLSSQGI
ncbi:MAG: hypothetical protein OEM32_08840, partial [Acidimicrobiia bacterium]|nr:hypothetical protein [Acidimicrobiia bacterium]